MTTALIIILVIIAILLMLVILAQNAKGGGFASNFSASNQLIGVKKTGDLLEKLTWGLAIAMLTGALVVNLIFETPTAEGGQASPNLQTTESPVAPGIGGGEAPDQTPSGNQPAEDTLGLGQ